MRNQPHVWTQVAEDVKDWITNEAPIITEMIRGDEQAPFAADISEKQKRAYYMAKFFNPDGSENAEGRAQELQRVGIPGYVQIMHDLTTSRTKETEDAGNTY